MKDLNQTAQEAEWISNLLFEDSTGKGYPGDVSVAEFGRKGPANNTFSGNAVRSPNVKPPTNEKVKPKKTKPKRMYKAGTNPEDNIREVRAAKSVPGDVSVAEFGRKGPASSSKTMNVSRPKSDGDKKKGKRYKQGSNPEDNIKEGVRVTVTEMQKSTVARAVKGRRKKTSGLSHAVKVAKAAAGQVLTPVRGKTADELDKAEGAVAQSNYQQKRVTHATTPEFATHVAKVKRDNTLREPDRQKIVSVTNGGKAQGKNVTVARKKVAQTLRTLRGPNVGRGERTTTVKGKKVFGPRKGAPDFSHAYSSGKKTLPAEGNPAPVHKAAHDEETSRRMQSLSKKGPK